VAITAPADTKSLKEHLNLESLPLASSEEGKKFVMKALHPADHEIKATRVPGGIDNTVALAIDQLFDIPLDHDCTRLILAPCLETPFMVEAFNYDGEGNPRPYAGLSVFQPPAFGGGGLVSYNDATSLMGPRDNFESIAITSESFTAEFIAPALSNQGAVCSAQFPHKPQLVSVASGDALTAEGDMNVYSIPFCIFDNYPEKAACLSGTRAYSGKLTGGVYVPLRLTSFKQRYINDSFCRGYAQPGAQNRDGGAIPRRTFGGVGYMSDRVGMGLMYERILPLGNTWSVTYLDGYAKGQVSLRVRFRMTVEGRVYPGSSYAPLAEPPPVPDDVALKMYREIAGRLTNAYPASYNDWNKLKGTVLSLASKLLTNVAPWVKTAVKGLPYGSALSMLADPLIDGATRWVASASRKTSGAARPVIVAAPAAQPKKKKSKPAKVYPEVVVPAAKGEKPKISIVRVVRKP